MGILKTGFVILIILISGFFYYNLTGDSVREVQGVFASRVIDGDTIEIVFGDAKLNARLKGINCPEKGVYYYDEARNFLVEKVEGKNVEVVSFGGDKYNRVLVYVFLPDSDKSINEEILQRGFANLYYYEKDEYFNDLEKAEEFARLNEIGIWKKSLNADCIKLIELKYDEPEKLVLENVCDFDIEVLIKDEATHMYNEKLSANSVFEKSFSHIWNTEGDSLWVWDEKGLLVFYQY